MSQIYQILTERRGVVIGEELIAGSHSIIIKAHLPVAESFGINKVL
jgi:translation elongation factor EF-G